MTGRGTMGKSARIAAAAVLAVVVWATAASSARACSARKLCVEIALGLSDGPTGDYVGVEGAPNVPARGAHVIVVRPYPEPPLSGYLSVEDDVVNGVDAGCIVFDSQFAVGHKAIVEADAVLDYNTAPDSGIRVRAFGTPIDDVEPTNAELVGPIAFWVVNMPPDPDEAYFYRAEISDTQDGAGLATVFGTATETVYRLHGIANSQLTGLHTLNAFMRQGGQNANAFLTDNGDAGIIIGELGGLDKKFIIGHEIGHWLQAELAGGFGKFDANYGLDACVPPHDPFTNMNQFMLGCPHNLACQFFVVGTLEGMIMDDSANPNRHGIRSAEFSSAAMIEGFGHFVAAAAYNDLTTNGRYQYYKDIDEEYLTPYEDFENGDEARQIELAGGTLASTVGGPSRWVALECSTDEPPSNLNDFDHLLVGTPSNQEISSEIDWLRLFWQYATASYTDSDPVAGPGFWDSVDLVNESLNSTTPWSETAVWPRMDAALASFLGDKPDWLARWRALSENAVGGNGVFNGDTFP